MDVDVLLSVLVLDCVLLLLLLLVVVVVLLTDEAEVSVAWVVGDAKDVEEAKVVV